MFRENSEMSEGRAFEILKARLIFSDFYRLLKQKRPHLLYVGEEIECYSKDAVRKLFKAVLDDINPEYDSPNEICLMIYDFYEQQSQKSHPLLKAIRDTLMERVGIKNQLGLLFTYRHGDSTVEAEARLKKYIYDLKVEMGFANDHGCIDDKSVLMRRLR